MLSIVASAEMSTSNSSKGWDLGWKKIRLSETMQISGFHNIDLSEQISGSQSHNVDLSEQWELVGSSVNAVAERTYGAGKASSCMAATTIELIVFKSLSTHN